MIHADRVSTVSTRQRTFIGSTLALMLTALGLGPAAGHAEGTGAWTSHGPFCGPAFGVGTGKAVSDPAYLAVGGSLFRSRDRWASWSRVSTQLPDSYLSDVAVAPENPRIVYFVPWGGGGVFRSIDAGETWTAVFRGLPDPLVQELMVPAAPAGTVFAIAPYRGIYRSRDQGESWTDVSPPQPQPSNYFDLLAHPFRPERLAAHTLTGLWRSTDGGSSWTAWNAGLPDGTGGLGNLTFAPSDQDVAYVTWYTSLYRSQSGGAWTRVARVAESSAYVNALAATGGKKPVLLAGVDANTSSTPGVLRSRNGGKSWQPAGLVGETVIRLQYLPALGRVVAMTRRGAFYSVDGGATWTRTGAGIAASRVRSLAAAGSGGRTLVAGLEHCPGGLARSPDAGSSWQVVEIRRPGMYYGGGPRTDVEAMAAAPSRPQRVYGGIMDGVLRSDDGGLTWTTFPFGDAVGGGRVLKIAVHPTDPDLVLATGGHSLTRSRDGGRTWSHVAPEANTMIFEPGRPDRVLAALWVGGLTRSLDAGASWTEIAGTDSLRLGALAIDPRDSALVLGSSLYDDSLYRSVDGGLNWAPSDVGIEGIVRSLVFSSDGAEVFAAGDRGVFRSRDRGRTWERLPDSPSSAWTLVRRADGTLYAGTDVGVLSSGIALAP